MLSARDPQALASVLERQPHFLDGFVQGAAPGLAVGQLLLERREPVFDLLDRFEAAAGCRRAGLPFRRLRSAERPSRPCRRGRARTARSPTDARAAPACSGGRAPYLRRNGIDLLEQPADLVLLTASVESR